MGHKKLPTACGCRAPSDPSCINQTRNGTLSPFWEWTDSAIHEGIITIHSRDYDLWSYVVSRDTLKYFWLVECT